MELDELIEKIVNSCYKSKEDIYWLPFEKIFSNGEFNDEIVNSIKCGLNEHKDVKFCDVWNYCFFIQVKKCNTEETSDR